MISKEKYWKNRNDGKRGQGDYFNPVVSVTKPWDVPLSEPGTRKARREKDMGTVHGTGRMRRRGKL